MRKPNILLILSDDHGSWATGSYGNLDVRTPEIDKLAKNGVQFDNFFCTSPVCSPARASILTGKMPSQHGVHDWLNGGNLEVADYAHTTLNNDQYKQWFNSEQLDLEQNPIYVYQQDSHKHGVQRERFAINYLEHLKTYPEILKEYGYRCGLAGKWHVGATATKQPGFDFWRPIAKGGTNYNHPEVIVDGRIEILDQYVSEYTADAAIDFLSQQQTEPFYLSVHFTAPHSPWGREDHPQHIWTMYDQDQLMDMQNASLNLSASPTAPYPNENVSSKTLLHGYYTAITAMDEQIGRIVSALDEYNLSQDTIIIYTSDNGMNLGQHGVWGKGNGTYPLNFFEESIKVPFIYYDPNSRKRGYKVRTMVSQYDIYPTLLDICGIKKHVDESYPGKSLKPLFNCEAEEESSIVIYDEYGPNRMIRTERYKLIVRYDQGNDELYDLYTDPFEMKNLLVDNLHNEKHHALKSELESWFEKYTLNQFDGKKTQVTGFGQYDSLNNCDQPFEALKTKFNG